MANLFAMMLSQIGAVQPGQECLRCNGPHGYHYFEVYAPESMQDAEEDDPRWQEIADLQARGAFLAHAFGPICTNCLGEALTTLHGPSSAGLPMMIQQFGKFTILSLLEVKGNGYKMGVARGTRNINDMYAAIVQGRYVNLGG